MKRNFSILLILISVAGCDLIWGPRATAKNFMSAAQKGDVAGMTKLFSSKAIQRLSLEKIKSNNQYFADLAQKTAAAGGYQMDDFKETKEGDLARVAFTYHNQGHSDSLRLVIDMSKEGGAWKIDDIGGSDKAETPLGAPEPTPAQPTQVSLPAPPAPAVAEQDKQSDPTKHAPISGGVLNSKAITLPQPAYPPAARAAKASGTVNVQVTVDEKGNVTEAHAVSGHPLLQAAAVAAARGARFEPTKLSGEPVKVTGLITYNFTAP